MGRVVLGLGILLIIAGAAAAYYVGHRHAPGPATQAQTLITVILICGPGVLLTIIGAALRSRIR